MTRLFFSILTLVLFCSSSGHAYVRDYSKLEDSWKSEASKAYVSGKTTFEDGTTIINLFLISFEKKYGCRPVFKVSFLEDPEYGELLETIPVDSGFLKIYVDNKVVFDGPIVNILYSNVTELGATITPGMLKHIYNGNIVQVELVGKMDVIFSLNNSRFHIDKAQESCLQE
jgi:hypothetical protein